MSRLATVTENVTTALGEYRFADAARAAVPVRLGRVLQLLRGDGQVGACSEQQSRSTAQRILAHTLDTILRLLHPMIPFLTEEVWQLLGKVAAQRGLGEPQPAAESMMIAPWPEADVRGAIRRSKSSSPISRRCCARSARSAAGRTCRPSSRSLFPCAASRRWSSCWSRWARTSP